MYEMIEMEREREVGQVAGVWVFGWCTVCTMSVQCSQPADTISCLHCFNLTLNVQCVKYSRAFMNEFYTHTYFLYFALLYIALLCLHIHPLPSFFSPVFIMNVCLCVFFY